MEWCFRVENVPRNVDSRAIKLWITFSFTAHFSNPLTDCTCRILARNSPTRHRYKYLSIAWLSDHARLQASKTSDRQSNQNNSRLSARTMTFSIMHLLTGNQSLDQTLWYHFETLFSSWHLFGHPKLEAVQQQCLWSKKRTGSIKKIVRIVLVYSARAYNIVPGIYLRNNKMRQEDDGVLSSPLSQGSDRDETPLFVGFSHLGNI